MVDFVVMCGISLSEVQCKRTHQNILQMIEEILCDTRRQIRSIVNLCEEFGVRSARAKFTNQNDFLSAERRPHAALISSPREARMVVIMPRWVRESRKDIIFSSEGEKYGESGILWKRMRLIRHLMPSRRRHSSLMWRGESLRPLITIYSKDTRRW